MGYDTVVLMFEYPSGRCDLKFAQASLVLLFYFIGAACNIEMGTAVQIQNIGVSCFSSSDSMLTRVPRLEDMQKEQAQLTMEGIKAFTVSWWADFSVF